MDENCISYFIQERNLHMPDKKITPAPMSYKKADHLLNPLRKFILSPSKLTSRLYLKQSTNVLELGCGPGYYSADVAQNIPNGKLTLVDIQQEMLDMAKQRLDSLSITNIIYVQADATALPFENDTFDVVYLAAVIGEVPDKETCIREMHRVLRVGGLLSVTEQCRDPHFIPVSEMKSLAGDMFDFERTFGSSRNYTSNFRKK
jgi:ubiquinone/menaquinone biosynthesis C-methylase UbiE